MYYNLIDRGPSAPNKFHKSLDCIRAFTRKKTLAETSSALECTCSLSWQLVDIQFSIRLCAVGLGSLAVQRWRDGYARGAITTDSVLGGWRRCRPGISSGTRLVSGDGGKGGRGFSSSSAVNAVPWPFLSCRKVARARVSLGVRSRSEGHLLMTTLCLLTANQE